MSAHLRMDFGALYGEGHEMAEVARRSLHKQLYVAVDECGLTSWELSRKANVRQSLLDSLLGDRGRVHCEVLERVASALDFDVRLAPSNLGLRTIGPVPSAVDLAVMRYAPERMATNRSTILALDLEGVLISNSVSQFPRPGLRRFLTCCRGLFERMVMFTTVPEPRFRQIASVLVDEGAAPAWFARIEYVTWTGKTKDLNFVPGTDPGHVLLVDDMEPYVHAEQRDRWVSITGFEPPFDQPDGELDRVLEELARRVSEGV